MDIGRDCRDRSCLPSVNRGGKVWGERITEKVVWQLLQRYASKVGLPGIAPHDLRRYAVCRVMPNRISRPRERRVAQAWLALPPIRHSFSRRL